MYNLEMDGIDHINIYSKGKTPLGKFLSNWYEQPIYISIGKFRCIEGLIFFLGSFDDKFRTYNGWTAKKKGDCGDRHIRLPDDVFKRYIKEAMIAKLNQHLVMKRIFKENKLPLTHYYVYNGFQS